MDADSVVLIGQLLPRIRGITPFRNGSMSSANPALTQIHAKLPMQYALIVDGATVNRDRAQWFWAESSYSSASLDYELYVSI